MTVSTPSEPITSSLDRKVIDNPARIASAKKGGRKVIGYFCPYIPEELILAAGMIPVRLAFGGEAAAAASGEEYLKPYSCSFARSCLGYPLNDHPYFKLVDGLCVAQTCENLKLVQVYLAEYLNKPVFALGLPHTHDSLRSRPQALDYFTEELRFLSEKLGCFSGNKIKNNNIRKAISLENQIRDGLSRLFDYPHSERTPFTWSDGINVVQAGFILDRCDFLAELRGIEDKLKQKRQTALTRGARLMLMGSILAVGDHKVLDIVKAAGGNFVADDVCTGSATFRKNVTIFGIRGDPFVALAERYLYNVPCPCMTDLDKRLGRIDKVAQDFNIQGVIYYSLKFCDTWRMEYQLIKDHLSKELQIPSLLVESDYSPTDIGTLRTKVEAFIEMIEGSS